MIPAPRTAPAGGSRRRPERSATDVSRQAGVVSLEFALTVPLVFLVVLVVFHAAVYARDAVLVQHAAARGARVAASTASNAPVHSEVVDAVDGRDVDVTVSPTARRAGQTVTVTVRMTSRAGTGGASVTASASAETEPGVGE